MKFLLTFLMVTGLSLPLFAQTPSDQSVDPGKTEAMGEESRAHEGIHSESVPQEEQTMETDTIKKTKKTEFGNDMQKEEDNKGESMHTPNSTESDTTTP